MMAVNSETPYIPRLEMLGGNSGRKKRVVTQMLEIIDAKKTEAVVMNTCS